MCAIDWGTSSEESRKGCKKAGAKRSGQLPDRMRPPELGATLAGLCSLVAAAAAAGSIGLS